MTEHPPGPEGGAGASSRRPLRSRSSALAGRLTAWLLRTPVTPNGISLGSIALAGLAAWALWRTPDVPPLAFLAALCVQGRLLCNLLDGMVAVEGGRGTPVGALFNEIPDRVADSLLLVAWGHAAGLPWLGWLAALLACGTAYIRVLGGALGQPQDFRGPMAKQHRMALLTLVCLLAPLEAWLAGTGHLLTWGLAAVTAGTAWTCWARARAIAARLDEPSA